MVPSGPRWHIADCEPHADNSSARGIPATGHATVLQFDTTNEWTPFSGFKPFRLQCFRTSVWASALTTNLLPIDDATLYTGDGNFADDGSHDPYTFFDETSFFLIVDFIIYIFKTDQKDGQEAPQKGTIQEGQKEQEEEAQQEAHKKKIQEVLIYTASQSASTSTSTCTSGPRFQCTYPKSCTCSTT